MLDQSLLVCGVGLYDDDDGGCCVSFGGLRRQTGLAVRHCCQATGCCRCTSTCLRWQLNDLVVLGTLLVGLLPVRQQHLHQQKQCDALAPVVVVVHPVLCRSRPRIAGHFAAESVHNGLTAPANPLHPDQHVATTRLRTPRARRCPR